MKRGDLRKLIQEHRWVLPAKMSFYDWPDGWDDLVVKLVEDLAKEAWDSFLKLHIMQIKEKFGGLRVLHDNANERCKELIQIAEVASKKICQLCGAEGREYEGASHRFMTLCPDCIEKQEEK
jgi:hypothetical protein